METTGHAAGETTRTLAARTYGALVVVLAAVLVVAGCASGRGGAEDGSGESIEASTLVALGIPLGAVPRPGRCRIWRPGTPAARQSGPGSCRTLSRRVEAGGWLLRHPTPPEGGPDRVHLVVYGEDGPSLVRVFDGESGKVIRERTPE